MSLEQVKRLSYVFKTRPDGSLAPAGPAETHDGIINCEVVVYDDTRGSWVNLPMYDVKTTGRGPVGGSIISTTVESADGAFRVLLTYNNKRSLRVPSWTIQKPFVSRMFVDGREQAICETTVLPESRCNPVDLTSCFTAEQCMDGTNYFFWKTRSSDWPAITAPPSNGSLIDDHSSIAFRLQACTVHDVQKGRSKFPCSDPLEACADGDDEFDTVMAQHPRLSHYIHIADEDNESIASQDIPDFTAHGQPFVEFVIYYKSRALLQQLGIVKDDAPRARRTPLQRGEDACDRHNKHRRTAPLRTSTHACESLDNADPAQNIVNAHMNPTPPRTPTTSSRTLPQITGPPSVQDIEGASKRASASHLAPNTSSERVFVPYPSDRAIDFFRARANVRQPRPPLRPPGTRISDATEFTQDSARNKPEEPVLSRIQTPTRAETTRAAASDDIRDLSPSFSTVDLGRRGPQAPRLHIGSHHSVTHARELHSDQAQAMRFTHSQRRGVLAGQNKETAILCDSDDDVEDSRESTRGGGAGRADPTESRHVKVEPVGPPVKTSAEIFLTKIFPAGPHSDIVRALVKFGFRDETSFRDTLQQLVKEKELGPLKKLNEAMGYGPYCLLKNYIHRSYGIELED